MALATQTLKVLCFAEHTFNGRIPVYPTNCWVNDWINVIHEDIGYTLTLVLIEDSRWNN